MLKWSEISIFNFRTFYICCTLEFTFNSGEYLLYADFSQLFQQHSRCGIFRGIRGGMKKCRFPRDCSVMDFVGTVLTNMRIRLVVLLYIYLHDIWFVSVMPSEGGGCWFSVAGFGTKCFAVLCTWILRINSIVRFSAIFINLYIFNFFGQKAHVVCHVPCSKDYTWDESCK